MIFGEYYSAMDRYYGKLEPREASPNGPVDASGALRDTTTLGPESVGTSTNPMMHQTRAFEAKIREGAGKIEIGFMGAGKSNSQQPSPEAFGKLDRQDIRELAEINQIRTSVHAPLHGESLAGLGREGFSDEGRQHVLKEIERAIQFASEATKGGAIVFHTGEWGRPLTELKGGFRMYEEENTKAPVMVADKQTGAISAIRKDHDVYEPVFHTAKTYEKEQGIKLIGMTDKNGNVIEADDWVDIDGNAIKRKWLFTEGKQEELFNRVPVFKPGSTNFKVEPRKFSDFEAEAKKYEAEGFHISAEELFFKSQISNNVLRAKGQSLFYAKQYKEYVERRDALKKSLEFYNALEKSIPDDEKWNIMTQKGFLYDGSHLVPPKNMLPSEFLKQKLEETTNELRHIHESSAAADAQAQEAIAQMNRVVTVKEYGLEKSADTIAVSGIKAMRYWEANQEKMTEKIYVAPENFRPEQYGSHPDEIRELIQASRKKMQQQLVKEGYSDEEAKQRAKDHIKATVDIGHFNMWRQHFVAKDGEGPVERNKRFDKWLLVETQKLAKEGILGHIHLTDNFGYDDEHLTPGQGNVPMKEFIKRMEDAGLKDFIAEAGSFNGGTVMADTWALMGSPIYGSARMPTFRSMHQQQFGYHNPATYIVGAYAPSNEWHLWTEVPME